MGGGGRCPFGMENVRKAQLVFLLSLGLFLGVPGVAAAQEMQEGWIITTGVTMTTFGATDLFSGTLVAPGSTITEDFGVVTDAGTGAMTVKLRVWSTPIFALFVPMILLAIMSGIKWLWDLLPFL